MAADPNVLGLNIELQLRSQKFHDSLTEFIDGPMKKISDDLSGIMGKAIDSINLAEQQQQFVELHGLLAKMVDTANFAKPIEQAEALGTKLGEASRAFNLDEGKKQADALTDSLAEASSTLNLEDGKKQIESLQKTFEEVEHAYKGYQESVESGDIAATFADEAAKIAGQKRGFDNVRKAIDRKNIGHNRQNEALDESNVGIGDMITGMGDAASSASNAARVFGFMVKLLANVYNGVLKSAKGADEFATANFRAYGHQESILVNTQLLASAYGVLGKVALSATKALMEEGLRPERIAETTMMISMLTRVTGVGAEAFAETARQLEILGLTVSETGTYFNIATAAQEKYQLSTKETAELVKGLGIPGSALQRTFLTTTDQVLAFANTKAQIAGFAKSAGADIGKVLSYLNEIAKGSVKAQLSLMALSGIGRITPENMSEAFRRGGGQILKMLKGLKKGTLEYNMMLENIRDTYGLNEDAVESMIKADESYKKELKLLTDGPLKMTMAAAKQHIKLIEQEAAALQKLKKDDPTAYLSQLRKDYSKSIDNVTQSQELFYQSLNNIGTVLYSMFFPAFSLVFRVLAILVSLVAVVIEFIKTLWRGFVDLTGMSQNVVYWIKAIAGILVFGGLMLLVFGSALLTLGGLLPWLGRGLVWLKDRFLSLFTAQDKTAKDTTKNVKSLGERIKDFFVSLKEVATTMIKVAFAMFIMAGAVVVLAYAVTQLAALDYGKLWSAIGAVFVLMAILVGSMILLAKFAPGGVTGVIAMAGAMILMAVAVFILSMALGEMAKLGWGLVGAVIALAFIMAIMVIGIIALVDATAGGGIAALYGLAAVFVAVGYGIKLASEGLATLVGSFTDLVSKSDGIWSTAGALAGLGLGMFMVGLLAIPFALAMLLVGTTLVAFGIAMYFVRTSLEIVGNAILNLGNGMALIVQNSLSLNGLSKETISTAQGIGDALMIIAQAVLIFPLLKVMAVASVLNMFSALEVAASIIAQIGEGFLKIAEAATHTEEVNAFSTQLNDSLVTIADNVEGVAALQSIADAFSIMSTSVAELGTVNEVMIQLKNGLSLFDEVGNAPDNIERIGNALYNIPDLSNLAAAGAGLGELSNSLTSLLEVAAMEEELNAAIKVVSNIGPSLTGSAMLLLMAMPLLSSVSMQIAGIAPFLYFGSELLVHAGSNFGLAGEFLIDGVYYLAEAVSLMAEIDIDSFIGSVGELSLGLGLVSRELLFNALAFKISMVVLASSIPTISLAADEVDRLALALGQLADNIANLNSLGSININAESMVEAARKAAEAVENYQNTMAASQGQRSGDQKSMDSQPLNQVQVKTDGRDVRDDEDLQPDILRQLEIMVDLLRTAADAKNTSPVGVAAASETRSSESGSSSFNIGSWL